MYGATAASTSTSNRRQIPVKQPQNQQQAGLLKSSLDIVWSYSRSQAFFGSNLPSSPSFVQRYQRPARFSSDDDVSPHRGGVRQRRSRQSVGQVGDASTGELTMTEEDEEDEADGSDEEEEYEDEEDEEDESGNEEDVGVTYPALEGDQQSPWNALPSGSGGRAGTPRKSGRRRSSVKKKQSASVARDSSRIRDNATQSDTGSNQLGVIAASMADTAITTTDDNSGRSAVSHGSDEGGRPSLIPIKSDERAPLLEKRRRQTSFEQAEADTNEDIYSSSPPESAPFPRRSPHVRSRRLSDKKRTRRSAVRQGSSTSGQTLFNAINVLVGIGILAQPLAFSHAGWVLGCGLLIFYAALTNYTARILAKVLREDHRLMTYADIGAKAFGQSARNFINALFCLEISALCVALIVLLGDSLATIFPMKATYFKLIGFCVLFPTLFLPLRYLSIASLIGILSVVTLTITVLLDGTLSHSRPGSLHNPMPTRIGPSWRELPIAFGLIMSGFGGHAVIPSLARDMKKPDDFGWVCNIAFAVAAAFYLLMGILGYLMFGQQVTDEITRDLLHTPTLPRKLNLVAVCMVAITPICKYSLSSTPLESTVSYLLGVEEAPSEESSKNDSGVKGSGLSRNSSSFYSSVSDRAGTNPDNSQTGDEPAAALDSNSHINSSSAFSIRSQPFANAKPRVKTYARQIVKIVTSLVLLAIAIFIPSFDRVMGLLGAFSVFVICAILPLSANLALHRRSMSSFRIAVDVVLLLISVAMGVVGTVFVFLPKKSSSTLQ